MEDERMKQQVNAFCGNVVPFGNLDIQFALNYLDDISDYPADTLNDELENFKDSIGENDLSKIDIGYIAVSYVFQNARNKISLVLNIDIENDLGFNTYGNYLDSSIDRSDEDLENLQEKYNKATDEQKQELNEDKFFKKFAEEVGLEINN